MLGKNNMWIYVVLLLVVVASVSVLVVKFSKAQNWPKAEGKVEHFSYTLIRSHDADTDYKFKLQYRFEVDNESYTGDTLMLGLGNIISLSSGSTADFDTYKEGSVVEVFYNPDNPNESALEVLQSRGKGSPLVVLVIFMVVVVGLISGALYLLSNVD